MGIGIPTNLTQTNMHNIIKSIGAFIGFVAMLLIGFAPLVGIVDSQAAFYCLMGGLVGAVIGMTIAMRD